MNKTDNLKKPFFSSAVRTGLISLSLIGFIFFLIFTIFSNLSRQKANRDYQNCIFNFDDLSIRINYIALRKGGRFDYSKEFYETFNSGPICPAVLSKNLTYNPYYLGYKTDSEGYNYTICCKGENHKELGVEKDTPEFSSIFGKLSNRKIPAEYSKSLYTAVYENNPARVKELLATKPVLSNEVDTLGRTPLHTAAAFGYIDTAEMLIAYGVDINPRDEWGWTPLKWAKSRNRTEMVKLLKKHGATE